ncbi:MAG: rod shape-determining protein MreC [Bacteroidetes bacterium]|nr:rod shape-determining protein MreC [Bacteroidota bacterium]MCL5026386.1 rod shape-determining protein MreC [Chloroflexota bacterium]
MREWLTSLIIVALVGIIILFSFNLPQMHSVSNLLQQPFSILMVPMSGPAEGISSLTRTLEQAGSLQAENAALREQIGALEAEVARLQELGRENQSLREQLRLQQSDPTLQRTPARVIAQDPNSLLRSLIIVPQREEQLREGMTVVTAAGLVGRVVQANPSSAKVLLITDTTSAVTAMDQETRANGVVVGQRGPLLLMRYISQGDVVRPGDLVLTSGVGGIFPEGIPIGRIVSISRRDVDLYQQAVIEPAVEFDGLERVLVVTNYVPLRLE